MNEQLLDIPATIRARGRRLEQLAADAGPDAMDMFYAAALCYEKADELDLPDKVRHQALDGDACIICHAPEGELVHFGFGPRGRLRAHRRCCS